MDDGKQISPVSAQVWPWREEQAEPGDDRWATVGRALLESSIMALVAILSALFLHLPRFGTILGSMSIILFMMALVVPVLHQKFKNFMRAVGKTIGIATAWLLLVPMFYVCFTIGRIALLLQHKDPLCRKCPSFEKTYWRKHGAMGDSASYQNQY